MIRPLGLFGLFVLGALALSALPNVWGAFAPDPCRHFDCFCEAFTDGFVLQPINAYSNLAYVLVGALIVSAPPKHPRLSPRLYGWLTISIGLGSFFYHASLTRLGEWVDLMGMYALVAFMLVYNLGRVRPLSRPRFAGLYLALLTALGLGLLIANRLQQVYLAGLVLGALGLEGLIYAQRRAAIRYRYLVGGLLAFGLGGWAWVLGVPGRWCVAQSLLVPHAAWHSLSAVAAGLLFLYYQSERELEN